MSLSLGFIKEMLIEKYFKCRQIVFTRPVERKGKGIPSRVEEFKSTEVHSHVACLGKEWFMVGT